MTKLLTSPELDRFDRAILEIVQVDNQMSHAAIGEKVGLSGSAVRRRLTALRQSGVIAKDVSLIADTAAHVTLIVSLSFARETPAIYADFEAQMRALPEVKQCYHVSGNVDYICILSLPTLDMYETWAMTHFMANDAIARYDTMVVWSCKKFETAKAV